MEHSKVHDWTEFEKDLIVNFYDKTNIFNINHEKIINEGRLLKKEHVTAEVEQIKIAKKIDNIKDKLNKIDEKIANNRKNYELDQRKVLDERLNTLSKEECNKEYQAFISKYRPLYSQYISYIDKENNRIKNCTCKYRSICSLCSDYNNDRYYKRDFLRINEKWIIYHDIYKKYI